MDFMIICVSFVNIIAFTSQELYSAVIKGRESPDTII